MRWKLKISAVIASFAGLLVFPLAHGEKDKDSVPIHTKSGFVHAAHSDAYDMTKCADCHKSTTAGRPAPTTRGHAPCLKSGCHLGEFLRTSKRTKREHPDQYKSAGFFCATCHKTKNGEPPSRFRRAPANALFAKDDQREYHVEMNHRAHTERTACSTCHLVDGNTFKLVAGGPDHQQCSGCHDDSDNPMSNCTGCHSNPAPEEYFTKTRKKSDVRECSTTSDPERPCFKHERNEHRFDDNGVPIECVACHFMFKKSKYRGFSYETLADVKSAPLMDNSRDLAHKSCGARGCHKREVDDSMGTGRCTQCHSGKFMASSLVD